MQYLTERMRDAIRAHNKRVLVRSIGKTLLYELLVVAVWLGYAIVTKMPMLEPSAFFWTILMMLPFVLKKVHDTWLAKCYIGTITGKKQVERYIRHWKFSLGSRVSTAGGHARAYGGNRLSAARVEVPIMTVKCEDGSYETHETLDLDAIGFVSTDAYKVGDEIAIVRGALYPINLTQMQNHPKEVFCPYCAHRTDYHKKKCHWCKNPLIQER